MCASVVNYQADNFEKKNLHSSNIQIIFTFEKNSIVLVHGY